MQYRQAAGIDGLDGVGGGVAGQQGGGDVRAEGLAQQVDGLDAGVARAQSVIAQDDVRRSPQCHQFVATLA